LARIGIVHVLYNGILTERYRRNGREVPGRGIRPSGAAAPHQDGRPTEHGKGHKDFIAAVDIVVKGYSAVSSSSGTAEIPAQKWSSPGLESRVFLTDYRSVRVYGIST
jgi:hypothetical protein